MFVDPDRVETGWRNQTTEWQRSCLYKWVRCTTMTRYETSPARYLFPTTKNRESSKDNTVFKKLTAFRYRDFHCTCLSCASRTPTFLFELDYIGFYFTWASPDVKAYDKKMEVK